MQPASSLSHCRHCCSHARHLTSQSHTATPYPNNIFRKLYGFFVFNIFHLYISLLALGLRCQGKNTLVGSTARSTSVLTIKVGRAVTLLLLS